jgi:hypothetical protein
VFMLSLFLRLEPVVSNTSIHVQTPNEWMNQLGRTLKP